MTGFRIKCGMTPMFQSFRVERSEACPRMTEVGNLESRQVFLWIPAGTMPE
jgi:hypothetical protein